MDVSNAREMNNMSNNWCIIYLTSSSPAGFGALTLYEVYPFSYKYLTSSSPAGFGALTFYLLNLQRSNKATEWRNICSLAK
jgi:hypothetical protein